MGICFLLTNLRIFSMQIDGVSIERGTKKSWKIVAGETALGKLEVPITVISGAEDGPTLAVMAGCHPGELVPIVSAIKLSREIEPKNLRGTLLIAHLQNPLGFQFKVAYINPLDGVNLSSAYPPLRQSEDKTSEKDLGKSSVHRAKSVTLQVAEKLFESIVQKSDYLIDLHGGEYHEWLVPNIEILLTGDAKIDSRTRDFAKLFGIDLIWEIGVGGIAEMPNYPSPGMLVYESARRSIPAAYLECGREGKIEQNYVDTSYGAILNVMSSLGMIAGNKPEVEHEILVGGNVLFSKRGGLFISQVSAGDHLKKGQQLGHIMDLSGEIIEIFRAPDNGVLLNMITHGIANPGDMLYVIGSEQKK